MSRATEWKFLGTMGLGRHEKFLEVTMPTDALFGLEWTSIPQDPAERPLILDVTAPFPFEARLERLCSALA